MKNQLPPFHLRASIRNISSALALVCCASTGMAQSDAKVELKPVEISGAVPTLRNASEAAPSQGSLDARSAVSVVSETAMRDYMTPMGDYTQALAMTPGAFSYTANGVGMGDAKVTVRGLTDSNMVIGFDGIPFNDTNGVSHHSWVFFPDQFLDGAVIDRSPGSAATVGQATYGGSVNLKSRTLDAAPKTTLMASYGSWETNLLGLEHQTGQFGEEGKSSLMFTLQGMNSQGYETFNRQARQAASMKYEYAANTDTTYTAFASWLELKNNTPNIKGVLRSSFNNGDYTSVLTSNPTLDSYYGYNFYDIATDFEYVGVNSKLANGWTLEDKVYRYAYHNKQNYANATDITTALPTNATVAAAGTDKLNSYVTYGNLLRLSQETGRGTLRTGLWLEQANSYRFQVPANPTNWVDVALPNFSERYTTTTAQPYVEYEFKVTDQLKITPGVKYASYTQDFTHLQDNGTAVGLLGGTGNITTGVRLPTSATGGASSVANSITYTDVLPSLDVHYMVRPDLSVYGQVAMGDQIPGTNVFDVANATVATAPKATQSTATQIGTVWNTPGFTLAADVYSIRMDGAYTSVTDTAGNVNYYLSGTEVSQGVEVEGSVVLGGGFNLYMNASTGTVKYDNGQWVAGAPSDTETIALTYQKNEWDINLSANRVGQMYGDGKATGAHETFTIDPVVLTNLFVNYTVKSPNAQIKKAKLQLGVNNLMDVHAITAVSPSSTSSSSATPQNADLLTITPGRSVNVTLTLDF